MSDNNSNNGSENSEGYLKEETEENMTDVHFNGCASGDDETIEDYIEHSRLEDSYQPNSQSVSDEEEDMVKLYNNDLNYDDYDDYEGDARERVESVNSSIHLQQSEELRENEMVGVSDSDGEEDNIVEKEDQKLEKVRVVDNILERSEVGGFHFTKMKRKFEDEKEIDKQKEIKDIGECEELEEGEIADDDEEKSSSPPLMVCSSQSSICPPSILSSLNTPQTTELPLPYVTEPIRIYQPREKEVCRFYLRGICKNGDACRFRHCAQSQVQRPRIQIVSTSPSSTLITGGGKVPIYYNNKLANLTSIPPPIGPPISLLSTVFAPPPSATLLTRQPPPPPPAAPPPPSSTESVAWMEGLKKARELARRQKGEEMLSMNESNKITDENDDRSSLSPPLGSLSPNMIQTGGSVYVSSSDLNKHMNFIQNRRTIPPRVVVEAVSVVSSSHCTKDASSRSSTRSSNIQAKLGIPSLIDSIIEHPTNESLSASKLQKGERGQQRRALITGSNSGYPDPWARSSSNSIVKGDGRIMKSRTEMVVNVVERSSRRRRCSSSNSSSSHSSKRHSSHKHSNRRSDDDRHSSHRTSLYIHKEVDREREKSNKLKRQEGSEHISDSFNDNTSPDVKKSREAHSRRDASVGSSVSSASFNEYDKREIQSSVINTTKRNSRASSNDSSDTFASLSRESNATLGALLTYKTAYSPKNKFKGPRTPPMSERPESKNSSSPEYDDFGSRKISLESGHSFGSNERNSRRHSQTITKIKKEVGVENDEAPAAYRLSRRTVSKNSNCGRRQSSAKIIKTSGVGRKTRSSSSSSSSTSSVSSSSTSSYSAASATEERLKKSSKKHQKSSVKASSVSSLKSKGNSEVRGTQQITSLSLPLDELVREISSAESDCDNKDVAFNEKMKEDKIKNYSNNYSNSFVLGSKKLIKWEEETFNDELLPTSSQEICNSTEDKNETKSVDEVTKVGKMQTSTKRREQLLRKLQNVEQAIARQKQLKREGNVTASLDEKRTKLSSTSLN